MIDINEVKFDRKTRITIYAVTILLLVNSLNLILDRIVEILVTIEISQKNSITSIIFEVYSEFIWIWLDIVTMINAFFFM